MNSLAPPGLSARAALAAALLAVDPVGLGGAALRAAPGPLRDAIDCQPGISGIIGAIS
jgi:hypothetical protein